MVVLKTYNIKIKDMLKFENWLDNFNIDVFNKIYGFDIEITIKNIFLSNKCTITIYKQ
jgi:hypothetical protein